MLPSQVGLSSGSVNARASFERNAQEQHLRMLAELYLLRQLVQQTVALAQRSAQAQSQAPEGWTTAQPESPTSTAEQFGTTTPVLPVAATPRLEATGTHQAQQQQAASADTLSAGERSQGTTQAMPTTERDAVGSEEAVGQSAPAEAFVSRNLVSKVPKIYIGYASKLKTDNGSVSVTIPASQAAQLGLIAPGETPHPVSVSMSKIAANAQGLLSSGDPKKTISTTATGPSQHDADQAASLAL